METTKLKEELFEKIKTLYETVWEHSINRINIDSWLENFSDENERIHCLFLLSQFMYFGSRQMRYLLKILFQDLYRYRVIEEIRLNNNNTHDLNFINTKYNEELKATRFLGIGNPSESGPHLLYYFRQENNLPKSLFIHGHEIFKRFGAQQIRLSNPNIKRYVFIDDFCGSGSQAKRYSQYILNDLLSLNPNVQLDYLMLFSTKEGKEEVIKSTKFSYVETVFELDDTFKCFEGNSRYFKNSKSPIDINYAKTICKNYGAKLMRTICQLEGCPPDQLDGCADTHALGFNNGQLLIGFHHNTPDNTLPIIWYGEEQEPWKPIFKRYNKIYK